MKSVPIGVEFYTRAGCHLCEEAERTLRTVFADGLMQFTKTDVDSDPDLVARFGDCVPVVVIDGTVRFRGHVSPMLLRRLKERLCQAGI